ncbi:unnamed protein product [Didymodactylos carnosus]|uniref:Uncharacterized protein n=2 Tax=Didymodactylos carnosus TaxID=1234261 RepID=A0A8S2EBR1_9BILA|nr:unnamed protein product [Didymodactylos carnosus]CAF3910496.1 unnamed protein product [Didymodactylos carnosus]
MSINKSLLLINSTIYPTTSSTTFHILSSLIHKSTPPNNRDLSYYANSFPLSYDDIIDDGRYIYVDDSQQPLNLTNIYYPTDDILLINNTNLSSLYDDYIYSSSPSSSLSFGPFIYIFIILCVYILLTVILLAFSIYKQRQNDEYYFDSTEKENNSMNWKRFLISKMRKGDMEPLLNDQSITTDDNNDNDDSTSISNFPLKIV